MGIPLPLAPYLAYPHPPQIRCQLAVEFVQDLKTVAEDNKLLQLEMLQVGSWVLRAGVCGSS